MSSGTFHFERGKRAMADDKGLDALRDFEAALKAEPDNLEYLSYVGLMNALERGRTREGLEMARDAAERAPGIVAVHANLARIYLKMGDKAGAFKALQDGLAKHPNEAFLLSEIKMLGVRKPPVFKNLRREHPLNKYAGKVKHWLGR